MPTGATGAETADFLIIGAGVVGLTAALELRRRYPDAAITVIDKEKNLAVHGSGRNSGVLHAGFYYTADSLKARFTRDGNRLWQAYCDDKGLRINRCGKLVVAADETEVEGLRELKRRGDRNGVELRWLTREEAREIEPRVKTHDYALFSPATASLDPVEAMGALHQDCLDRGVSVRLGVPYAGLEPNGRTVRTGEGTVQAGYVLNAAGLYADRIARDFGFSREHRILPFKGLYLYPDRDSYRPRVNIYPVPNLKHPFLGVHFTSTVTGDTKIGPTAIPALWREHYHGTANFRWSELAEVVGREAELFALNRFGFRNLAFEEVRKYRRRYMIAGAARMLEGVEAMGFRHWGKPGIRAQLIDIRRKALEMDFRTEGDSRSLHVLNAVSPAFTCAFPFAGYLVDQMEALAST